MAGPSGERFPRVHRPMFPFLSRHLKASAFSGAGGLGRPVLSRRPPKQNSPTLAPRLG